MPLLPGSGKQSHVAQACQKKMMLSKGIAFQNVQLSTLGLLDAAFNHQIRAEFAD